LPQKKSSVRISPKEASDSPAGKPLLGLNYEAIFSGTMCRGTKQPDVPATCTTPTTSKRPSAFTALPSLARGNLKKGLLANSHLVEPNSEFHRAVVRLVENLDLQLLDTSSESGYGSDQDSLNNLANMIIQRSEVIRPPPVPSRGLRPATKEKKSVRFDSYVMLLQGLRDRNLDLVRVHLREVCDEALATEEVVNEFLTIVIEGNEPLITEMLTRDRFYETPFRPKTFWIFCYEKLPTLYPGYRDSISWPIASVSSVEGVDDTTRPRRHFGYFFTLKF
jgi:hypothetical protein